MNVLIATEKPFAPVAVKGICEVLAEAGHTATLLERYTPEQLAEALPAADAMIVRSDRVDAGVMAAATNLKIVVRAGAGYDNVDLAAATARGIVVENTPGQNSNAVAELVFGLAVMAVRGMYAGTSGTELRGKRIGLQAFGAVGRCVARIAAGFGMTVSAYDPFCPPEAMREAGVQPVDTVEELYRTSDILSIHIPATPATRGSIGRELIGLLPKGAVLINTARKEVMDEAGLTAILAERADLRYMADVRPDCADALAEAAPGRTFFTPKKMGAQTAEANINAGLAAARQIAAYFATGDERFRVNR
ncbi:MAG: 3-phosphoglycerate dehydrogenase [Muribaculaceae bacterium]|nr:3-phosphoglycerate dehydrogenase [Muribaculaceae bacterium]